MKYKILIAESLDIGILERVVKERDASLTYGFYEGRDLEKDINFFYSPDVLPEQLDNILYNYNGLLIRPKPVSEESIRGAKELKLIIRGGAGVNTIALEAAKNCGVVVENTPGQNSVSTAEFAFYLISELVGKRNIIASNSAGREGDPGLPDKYAGCELAGKKIAIIGLGNIGQALAKRCQAFDMEVIGYSRSKKNIDVCQFDTVEELLSEGADIVSLNVPLSAETTNLIDDSKFKLMKKGTVLINTARPQLVCPLAFGKALESGILESAGIDGDYPLIKPFIKRDKSKKCLLTHHIADATKQAQEKIANQVLVQVFAFFREGLEINRVI